MKSLDDRPVQVIDKMDLVERPYSFEKLEDLILNNPKDGFIVCDDINSLSKR